MHYQVVQEAQRGQTAAALADVQVIMQMSRHATSDPILIALLMARNIEKIGYLSLDYVLARGSITPQQAGSIRRSFPATNWTAALHRAMRAERAYGLVIFEMLNRDSSLLGQMTADPESPQLQPLLIQRIWWRVLHIVWTPFRKLDIVEYIHYMNGVVTIMGKSQFATSASLTASDAAIEKMPWYAYITRLISPVYARISYHCEVAEVTRRQAEVAIALCLYQTAAGRYPAQLSAVTPASAPGSVPLPLDPYTGKPFFYKLEGQSYLMYSAGPNRADDGGQNGQSAPGGDFQRDDITWQHSHLVR
jgi:hypothetical protein